MNGERQETHLITQRDREEAPSQLGSMRKGLSSVKLAENNTNKHKLELYRRIELACELAAATGHD